MSAGKGMAPRKGYNWAKYAENYDGIFRRKGTEQPEQPMKTPEQEQPTVLPWHREAAKEINKALLRQNPTVSAIIASHDPHDESEGTTLRLLERALSHTMSTETGRIIVQDAIRAHLAAMQKSAKQEGRQ